MRAYRKAEIRELTSTVYQLDGRSVEGILQRNPVDNRWMVGNTPLHEWLERNQGQEIALLLIPMTTERAPETRTCQTCGREYIGAGCAYCREVRFRLRGQ